MTNGGDASDPLLAAQHRGPRGRDEGGDKDRAPRLQEARIARSFPEHGWIAVRWSPTS